MNMRGQKTILAPSVNEVEDEAVKKVLQFLIEAVEELNRATHSDIARVSEILPESDDKSLYIGVKEYETTDPYSPYVWADGSWRFTIVSNRLESHYMQSGEWVRKAADIP